MRRVESYKTSTLHFALITEVPRKCTKEVAHRLASWWWSERLGEASTVE